MYFWIDEMIEGLVEEETKPNIIEEAKTYWDSIKDAWICPEGYIFKDENGNVINATKIVLEKKKKEYPKTYEKCRKILKEQADVTYGYKKDVLHSLQKHLICRDAYWKLYGEDMGLGKPWEPDWNDTSIKYCLERDFDAIDKNVSNHKGRTFAFPTEEMRDAFKENFDKDLEICKEFL